MTELPATMTWRKRWNHLIDRIVRVRDHDELAPFLSGVNAAPAPRVLAFVNAHAMNSAAQAEDFYKAIADADLIVRDGTGMLVLFRMLALHPGLNLNGTDLIPKIICQYDGRPIGLYGTRDPYLLRAQHSIKENLAPNSHIHQIDGFQDIDVYVELARRERPALVILGMGMPKQELVAAAMRKQLDHPCLIICGGAIIDFIGGKTPRAPVWVRKMGSEWVYRLALEPNRLFNRYVVGNPMFMLRACCLALLRALGGSAEAPSVEQGKAQK